MNESNKTCLFGCKKQKYENAFHTFLISFSCSYVIISDLLARELENSITLQSSKINSKNLYSEIHD